LIAQYLLPDNLVKPVGQLMETANHRVVLELVKNEPILLKDTTLSTLGMVIEEWRKTENIHAAEAANFLEKRYVILRQIRENSQNS
jgi:hypothetical protein